MNEKINKKLELQGKYREPSLENFRNINNEISENLKSCEIKQLENFEGVIYNIGGEADSCIHSNQNLISQDYLDWSLMKYKFI